MTREVAGAASEPGPAGPAVLMFDLGELTHERAVRPPVSREPIRSRLSRLRPPSRRTAAVVVAVAALAGAIGWQMGAGRSETRQAALVQAHPPALAWLTFLASSANQETGTPHTVLDLNILNLGTTDLRVSGIVSHTSSGTVQAELRPNATVVAVPGETAHRIVDVRSSCATPFVDASLQVDLRLGDDPGRATPAHVEATHDGSVGIPYPDILRVLCTRRGVAAQGGLIGVYVQQTSSAGRATLVLTNRSSASRLVTLRSLESDNFRVVTNPETPLELAPGGSASLLLRVRVVNCAGSGRLSNWADGMSLVVQSRRGADPSVDTEDDAASMELRDVLLAPAGGAVAATCR